MIQGPFARLIFDMSGLPDCLAYILALCVRLEQRARTYVSKHNPLS